MREPLREVEVRQEFLGAGLGFGFWRAGNERGDADILHRVKFGQQVVELKYKSNLLVAKLRQLVACQLVGVDAVDDDLARVGFEERAGYLQKGSLARAARAYDGDHLRIVDVEVDAFQHLEVAERFGYVFELYHLNQVIEIIEVIEMIESTKFFANIYKVCHLRKRF